MAESCKQCQGRGWHVGDCHPREVCGACDGTGTVACCPKAISVETPTQYVWRCPIHNPAPPCQCRVPGPGNGDSKCKAPMRWVCQCECHASPTALPGKERP